MRDVFEYVLALDTIARRHSVSINEVHQNYDKTVIKLLLVLQEVEQQQEQNDYNMQLSLGNFPKAGGMMRYG